MIVAGRVSRREMGVGHPCGLDFGTSNSTLGVVLDVRPTLVALEGGDVTLPSAVFFDAEEGTTLFGREAMAGYVSGAEGRFMRAFKTILGTALMAERTRIGKRSVGFTDILGAFLAHAKKTAEERLGVKLTQVVVGQPAHFVDGDEAADARAREQLASVLSDIGFRDIAFQYEPIAAAFDFEQRAIAGEQLALIVDIGGGTSDFSVIRTRPASAARDRSGDILATHGVRVGGTDLDRLLAMGEIMPLLGHGSRLRDKNMPVPSWLYGDLATWHRVNSLYTPAIRALVGELVREAERPDLVARLLDVVERRQGHALLARAEAAKIALATTRTAWIELVLGDEQVAEALTRSGFAALVVEPITRLRLAVAAVLDQAGIAAADIQSVFLTGGTTLAPAVGGLFATLCPKATIVPGDRFGSVGMGLAIDAARRFAAG